ncbi:MAG TPA: aryl-sulfate sulfotransferase, partial [Anaerolineae bacterium]
VTPVAEPAAGGYPATAPSAEVTPGVLPVAGAGGATPTGGALVGALVSSPPATGSGQPPVGAAAGNPGGAVSSTMATGPAVAAQYVSPRPGSSDNPITGTVALRYGDPLDPNYFNVYFRVNGSSSGLHPGRVVLSDDGRTLIFKPDDRFANGESVSVDVEPWTATTTGKTYPRVSFTFETTPQTTVRPMSTAGKLTPPDSAAAQPGDPPARYVTAPADLPAITTTVAANGIAPGYIFASNFQTQPGPSGYYLLILDDRGGPVYYQKLPPNTEALDFKALSDGTLSYADRARNAIVIMDNRYQEVKLLQPGNGYADLDFHDLLLLPGGHYLLMANEARVVDLSGLVPGGSSQAEVTGQVIQELDKSMNVVFQWRALDYFPITETDQSLTKLPLDYSHINSIALDRDGSLLVSIRHLDQVVKIDRGSAAVVWRLGGKANQFKIDAAPGIAGPAEFYHQHDVRLLPNGHLTVFDNHNDHQPQVSRALEYTLDTQAKTATLVWAWQTDPAPYAEAMGNLQRLANGNSVIGWGTNQLPNISEVKPDGTPALELDFGGSNVTYRAYRFAWQGQPTWPPALVAQRAGDALLLSFSWNGATGVASYRILGGDRRPAAGQLLANKVSEKARSGFETQATLPDAVHGFCYYQVVPLDGQGKAGTPSGPVVNPARAEDPACGGTAQAGG